MLSLLIAGIGIWTGSAWAGPVDTFGFGARNIGRGTGGMALVDDTEGIFLNPAGLSRLEQQHALLGIALIRMDFPELPELWWDTNRDGLVDDLDSPLTVEPGADSADGFQVAIGQALGDRLGVGFGAFLPVRQLVRVRTFDPAIPTYFLYENRPHRYSTIMGVGYRALPGLSLGLGFETAAVSKFSTAVTFSATVSGPGEGDSGIGDIVGDLELQTHEIAVDLVPKVIPRFSMSWDLGEFVAGLDGLHLAAGYRGSSGDVDVDASVDIQTNFHVEELGDLAPMTYSLALPLQLQFMEYYVPARIEGGVAWANGGMLQLYVDLQRTAWDEMAFNIAQVVSGEIESQLITIADPTLGSYDDLEIVLRPTLGFRAGGELILGSFQGPQRLGAMQLILRGGGGYEQSPLVSQGTSSALLDADRLMLTSGLGLTHGDLTGGRLGPLTWDGYFSYHILGSGELPYGDGSPRAGTPIDGSTVPVGGHFWTAGFQGSVDY